MIKQSKVTSLSTTGICECSVSEFKVHGSKFLIMSVYRPCSGDINDFLANMDEVLLKCLNNNSIIVAAGDFNIPMHNDNKDKENFFALMNSYNLFPTVKDFTRVTSTSQSLIDIFTNSKEYSVEVFHNWISDHTAQKIIYYVKRQNKQHIVKRVFNQRNKDNLKKKIEKVTWAEVYKSDKEDNQIAIQQALDSEKEMNSLLEEQKKLVEEMDFEIKELKKEAADKGKKVVSVKTMDTQTNTHMMNHQSTMTDPPFNSGVDTEEPKDLQKRISK
ncbi:hypothetical protein JTB14_022614 [Gonioctena quinquepunctata]|nr:hypothetical protein JTB14_022614 [Gonioctena quinquepunctata]